jgi:hypothetical protein
MLSGETNTLFIEGLTQKMVDRWEQGELVQIALAGIPQELREFIMTGITPQEWLERLPPEPEDEEEWLDSDYVATMINKEMGK